MSAALPGAGGSAPAGLPSPAVPAVEVLARPPGARPWTGALAPGLRQAAPLALAGLVANGANVVVTVVLARLLAARGYGALTQLTGLFLVVSTPGSAVIVAVVRRVTATVGAPADVGQWARRLHRRATTALAASGVVACALGPVVAALLRRPGAAGIDAVTVAGGVWIVLCLDRGLLQGARAYRPLSCNLLAEGASRTVAMVGLVAAGLGVTGAAVGILVAEVATALHARAAADRAWRPADGAAGTPTPLGTVRRRTVPGGWVAAWRAVPGTGSVGAWRRVVRADLAAALVALATIALLQNVDVIVMGREAPSAVGAYAAVSVSAKALVFAALVVGGYLLPEAAIRWEAGGHALRQLAVTLLLLAVPAGAVVGVAAGLARPFLSGLFSARYLGAAGAFLPLALAMVCLATTVVVTLYLLAVGDRRTAWLLVAGAVAAVAAVGEAGGAPRATALADLGVQALVLVGALLELAAVHRRPRTGAGHGDGALSDAGLGGRRVVRRRPESAQDDDEPAVAPAPVRLRRAGEATGTAGGGSDVLRAIATEAGLERVRVVAWRDIDDPEAGGSELHAHRIASHWAAAGLDVVLRTSSVPGGPETVERDGYLAVRRSGRYAVFARTAAEGLRRPPRRGEALVEIWNGMPFWSPVWFRGPRVVFLHHVHAEMWRMVLPAWMARVGESVERQLAPPLYRRTRVVTLSDSGRDEIVEQLGLDRRRVSVVAPGVEPRFAPGGTRTPAPLVVAVGRLVPVKRFDLLLRALGRAKRAIPALRAVVVGEGYERPALEILRWELGATDWLALPGRVGDDELLAWYRRAWVVAATSLREGWGMTLTEAGACGTPVVATDIAGHRDAVVDGRTGLLAVDEAGVAAALERVLGDAGLRARMGREAFERARRFRWEETARATLEALAEEAYWAPGADRSPSGRRRARRLP